MKVRDRRVEGQPYRVAIFDERPPCAVERAEILAGGITGLELTGASLKGLGRGGLDWVVGIPDLRYLEVSRSPTVPAVPSEVLERLEVVGWLGATSQRISTSALPRARVLAVGPAAKLEGSLAECVDLVGLTLTGFAEMDFGSLDGCERLEWLKVQGRGQVVRADWRKPPERLQRLMLHDLYLDGLEAFGALASLRHLYVDVSRLQETPQGIDVSPLARCAELRWLQIAGLGRLDNVGSLVGLAHLQELTAYDGCYTPEVVPAGLPLRTSPKPVTRRS